MDKFKHILFEYSILIEILIMFFIVKIFIWADFDSRFFAFAIFIIYLRHHHLGSEVEIEKAPHGYFSKSVKRHPFYWLDILTYPITMLFLTNTFNFYWSALVFIIWFIITDILRVRYSVYNTYISRWFYTSKININNKKWELYKADKDPFPSIPHMHALNAPMKLNIYTGEIYDTRNKILISVASKKDLKKLWSDKNFISAVENARQVYKECNPKRKLPSIPTFN
jgi:hypothetical protein